MKKQHPRSIFYHSPCLDGAAAAWAVHKKYGETVKYIGLDHADFGTIKETILANITSDTIAVFVDFAPRRDILESIIEHVAGIEIYDHHISAQKELKGFASHPKCKIIFDMERSGAGIAYDVFVGGSQRPLWVNLLEKIDLYQPEKFDSWDQFFTVSAYFSALDMYQPLSGLMKVFDALCDVNDISWFEEKGNAPRETELRKIENIMTGVNFIDISFLKNAASCTKVPVLKADINELGHEFSPKLLASCPMPEKIGAVWCYHDPETIKLSFRSNGEIDVSMVAAEIGDEYGLNGGGHRGAAAVRLSKTQFQFFANKSGLKF